jgi:serine/threonine-protein kinase
MQHARQLGRYQLLDRVAFGGMAEIYRAKTQDADGRTHLVAVKRVLGHLCEDDEFIQMLVDEAKITAALQHENIARIYEFCRTDREYFIAMEYVDGKDVRALLEKTRQSGEMLPEEHVAWVGKEIARALHAAHTQRDRDGRPLRIVHRDVSPSNVLLSYRGEVKLCDFGIAKATLTRVQTKTGVIKGKVKYMSPEQAMGRKLDHRSDLFSLGTLLYEMLTLQAPFQAPTEIELIFAVRDARKRAARELRPGVHPELEAIVERAMARSRSQRFQSGEEMAQALQAFLEQAYPGYRRSYFGRYLRNTFAREIDRELRLLEEFVIEGGRAEEVGENLLADVLGPNAPYTQFTAAFVEGSKDLGDLADLPTGGKERLAEEDLADRQTPVRRPLQQQDLRSRLDAGWGPDPQASPLPPPPPPFDEEAEPPLDPAFHNEQTRILTRAQVLASMPGLHDASTQIFDLRRLPKEMQEALRPGADLGPAPPRRQTPAHAMPEIGGPEDIHEADTAYLPRAQLASPPSSASAAPPRAQAKDELHLPGVRVQQPAPAPPPPASSFLSGEMDSTTHPEGRGSGLHDEQTPAGPSSFNNLPTQLRDPRKLTDGVEITTGELSFIGGASEPSVVLDEDDLEQVD